MIVAHDLFFPAHGITNQVILGFGQLNSSINNMNANMTVGFQELNTNINNMRADVVHRLVSLENRGSGWRDSSRKRSSNNRPNNLWFILMNPMM